MSGWAYLVLQDFAGEDPVPVLVTTDEALATAIGARLGGERPWVRLPLVAAAAPPATAPPGALGGYRLAARPAGEEAWNEQLRLLTGISYDLHGGDARGELMGTLLMVLADVVAGVDTIGYHTGLLLTAGILEAVPSEAPDARS